MIEAHWMLFTIASVVLIATPGQMVRIMACIAQHVAQTPQETLMLALRPNCECCDRNLPPDSIDARICSFECTFCANCAEDRLRGFCPNCGGELITRPRRPAGKLVKHPASTERVFKPAGCASSASATAQA